MAMIGATGRSAAFCALAMLAGLAGCTSTEPLDTSRRIPLDDVPVTYDDRVEDCFSLNNANWTRIVSLFAPPATTPLEERRRIRAAIALFERFAGDQTPTWRDLGEDENSSLGCGNVDCIGETHNTMTYLTLLQQHGLLRWHVVMGSAFRDFVHFDTHFSAQIRDETDGMRYVVDSWYLDHAEPPFIQPTKDWLWRVPWPAEENPLIAEADLAPWPDER